MSRLKICIEEKIVEVSTDEAVVDSELQQLDIADDQLEQDIDSVEEAQDIQDGLDNVSDVLENSVEDDGEGINPEVAQAIEISTEHFAKRLDVRFRVLPSLESFKGNNSKQATMLAMERIDTLQAAVDKSLVVANEGIIDDIKNGLSMMTQTENKILNRLENIKKNKFDKEKIFNNDTWTKYIPTKDIELDGADIIKIAQDAVSASKSDKVAQCVKDFISGIKKLNVEIRGIWFWSNARDIQYIEAISKQITETAKNLQEENKTAGAGNASLARSFTSPNEAQAKRISALIVELIGENSLEDLTKELDSKSSNLKFWSFWNSRFRIKNVATSFVGGPIGSMAVDYSILTDKTTILDKLNAEDLQKSKQAAYNARKALVSLRLISSKRIKLASALTSYLERSAS